jgi:hypothetical protein
VEITAVPDEGNPRKIWISYVSDEAQLIRAFALDIVATGGNIIDVNDYPRDGDNNNDYGIFPSSFRNRIEVDPETGLVVSWAVEGYSPVADPCDPDALGGIGTPGVTIEMGSLYENAPPSQTSGTLCSVTVDDDVTKLCVTANAIRGNVVLEDANEPQNLVLPDDDTGDCVTFGDDCILLSYANLARWETLGKPWCWCPAGTTQGANPISRGMQCRGDADNVAQWDFYEVFTDDLNIMISDWKGLCADPMNNPCADFDNKCQWDFYSVFTDDLDRLIDSWKDLAGTVPTDCPW